MLTLEYSLADHPHGSLRSSRVLAVALAALLPFSAPAETPAALASFRGAEFEGGAKDLFGSVHDGEEVNYVYALPTGKHSSMHLGFEIKAVPPGPLFLHLAGRDDDGPAQCVIAIELNGKSLFSGRNDFPADRSAQRAFVIPEGALVQGSNRLVIVNRELQGSVGAPPWFRVAFCAIAAKEFVLRPDAHKDFYVALPTQREPFPRPLQPGEQPGFKFRGTKGWIWTPEQYLAEIPYLAKFKMTFLMICAVSMWDTEHHDWLSGKANRWWEDLSAAKKAAYEGVVRECKKYGLDVCFSMNPNLASERMFNDGKPDSLDLMFKHYAWMQSLGVKWFEIAVDDATQGIDASSQARAVNAIFHRLRAKDPEAQMIFCPTYYWGDGTGKEQQPYHTTLARELDKDIYLFWTGEVVVGRITRKAAESFRRITGHRLFLWDNYPVNDNAPTMHLGPVIDRDPDLGEVVDGYMSNPMCTQNQGNRLPLATCADYAYNPRAYDPGWSIGQAILHVAERPSQQLILRELVETYPGMLIYGNGNTGFNAAQEQFRRIISGPHSRQAALAYLEHLQRLSAGLKKEFPTQFQPEKQTLDQDIQKMQRQLAARYQDGVNR